MVAFDTLLSKALDLHFITCLRLKYDENAKCNQASVYNNVNTPNEQGTHVP